MSVWLITGSGSGIGLALARLALAQGEQVVLTARKTDHLLALAQSNSTNALVLELDITVPTQAEAAVAAAVKHFGRLDILVNNAGRGLVGALEEYSPEQIRANFETNFFGSVNMIRAALPHMRAARSGRIVNISAVVGFANEVGFSIYGAAKFALEGLSESLQSEVRHLGIKILIVEPGPFRTEFIQNSMDRATATIDDYKQSSGKFADFLTKLAGTQPGDPEKAALVIYKTVLEERPPARLLLGPYAHKKARDKMRRWSTEIDQWEASATATDF